MVGIEGMEFELFAGQSRSFIHRNDGNGSGLRPPLGHGNARFLDHFADTVSGRGFLGLEHAVEFRHSGQEGLFHAKGLEGIVQVEFVFYKRKDIFTWINVRGFCTYFF